LRECEMFGGAYPNIDRWATTAGRYEGAKAEKAVPFPSVAAHRSPLLARHEYSGSQRACDAGATPAAGQPDRTVAVRYRAPD
jgi:hypothetical protein